MKNNLSMVIPTTLIVLASLLIGSASAGAAVEYQAKRPGLEVDLEVHQGGKLWGTTHLGYSAITCTLFKHRSATAGWGPLQLNSEGRFFSARRRNSANGNFSTFGLKGERRDGKIYGKTMYRGRIQYGRNEDAHYRCWSGKSWKDPWVRFVARRQRR